MEIALNMYSHKCKGSTQSRSNQPLDFHLFCSIKINRILPTYIWHKSNAERHHLLTWAFSPLPLERMSNIGHESPIDFNWVVHMAVQRLCLTCFMLRVTACHIELRLHCMQSRSNTTFKCWVCYSSTCIYGWIASILFWKECPWNEP